MEWSNEIDRYHYSSQFYGFVFSLQIIRFHSSFVFDLDFFNDIKSDYVDYPFAVLFHGSSSTFIITRS